MNTYVVETDGYRFECQSVSVDDAIRKAFDGDGISDIASMETYFNRFNGRCIVRMDAETVTITGVYK